MKITSKCPKCHLENLVKTHYGVWKCPSCGFIEEIEKSQESFFSQKPKINPEGREKKVTLALQLHNGQLDASAIAGDKEIITFLINTAQSLNKKNATEAIRLLIKSSDHAVEPLSSLLEELRTQERIFQIMDLLAKFDASLVNPIIARLLYRKNVNVRCKAIAMLMNTPEQPIAQNLSYWYDNTFSLPEKKAIVEASLKNNDPDFQHLILLKITMDLHNPRPNIRHFAIAQVNKFHIKEALSILKSYIDDPDQSVREYVQNAIKNKKQF